MKTEVNLYDLMKQKEEGSYSLITEEFGAVKGCCSGVTIYDKTEYQAPGNHEDQEGFFVLEGHGFAKVGEEEFEIKPGSSFLAPVHTDHSIKRDSDCERVLVFWFHSAV